MGASECLEVTMCVVSCGLRVDQRYEVNGVDYTVQSDWERGTVSTKMRVKRRLMCCASVGEW